MRSEEASLKRMKEICDGGFYANVCEECSGGVRHSTMSVCPTCDGYGFVRGAPRPLPLCETQRTPSNINDKTEPLRFRD